MNNWPRPLATVAFFGLLVLVAAACGGADGVPETEPAAAPEADLAGEVSAATAVPEPTPATAAPAVAPTATPTTAASARTGGERRAPEIKGIDEWINSEPFTLESKRGNVVLIDFWTYTCVNCIRTLPYLLAWHDRYADAGLVIVGVHTPEFKFEEKYENVVQAVEKFDIKYAVAQDNDYATWNAFRNRFWPAKYLIDKDGYIRYTHFGEGAYEETEGKIRELLAEAGSDIGSISPGIAPDPDYDLDAATNNQATAVTRELYAGYERNNGNLRSRSRPPYILHSEYYDQQDADNLYTDPGSHQNHFIYLNGLWRNKAESLVHARATESYEDYIAIKFYATSVNVVMAPATAGSFTVRLTIDEGPIDPEQAGRDVIFDEDGNSHVVVDGPRMYRLVNQSKFGGHELRLSSNSSEFELFAFTFGGYKGGEPGF